MFTDSNAGEIASHHDEQERAIELIAALQTGPSSRELSDRVLRECGWINDLSRYRGKLQLLHAWYDSDGNFVPDRPDPTQSIDDALALVPDGYVWELQAVKTKDVLEYQFMAMHLGIASTPAAAICIAILKEAEDTSA